MGGSISMVIFILGIAAIMMISALAIKIFILFKYFQQKEKEVAITQQDETFTSYKNLNEKGIFSENQVEEIISQYKKSESERKLNEEKEALLKLKDMKILSDEEYNEKMFILEDLYKCGKI
jgi:cell division protein YceG involved in septum cleavage